MLLRDQAMNVSKKIVYLLSILLILSVITPYEAVSSDEGVALTITNINENGLIEIRISNNTGNNMYFTNAFLPDGNCIRFQIKDESGNSIWYKGPLFSLPWSENNLTWIHNNQFFGQAIHLRPPFFNLTDGKRYTIQASYSTLHLKGEFEEKVWIGIVNSNVIILNYKNVSP